MDGHKYPTLHWSIIINIKFIFSWNSIAEKTNKILDKILPYEVDPFKEIDINFSSLEFKILTRGLF